MGRYKHRPPPPEPQEKTKRMDMRILPRDKEKLILASKLASETLTQFMLKASLARARRDFDVDDEYLAWWRRNYGPATKDE